MRNKLVMLVATVAVMCLVGCAANIHVVGNGAKGGESVSATQWYAVWGLVPMGMVDTKKMSGDATDYTIITKASFLDSFIGMFTSAVSISRRTVIVEK